jgi:hypothetical protein
MNRAHDALRGRRSHLPAITQGWVEGPPSELKSRIALGGGNLDRVLREYGKFDEIWESSAQR